MTTLAIETSTAHGSVAVSSAGELLFAETFTAARSHSSALFAVLERARGEVLHIDQIVVGLGPGSYAGIRIAIAAALGLELGLGAKLVGIPSVAVLEISAARYLVVGDARRDSFYFAAVDSGVCIDGPRLATEDEVRAATESFGTWPLCASEPVPRFHTATIAAPSATILARNAGEKRGLVQSDTLEPIYLREPHITKPKRTPVMLPPTDAAPPLE